VSDGLRDDRRLATLTQLRADGLIRTAHPTSSDASCRRADRRRARYLFRPSAEPTARRSVGDHLADRLEALGPSMPVPRTPRRPPTPSAGSRPDDRSMDSHGCGLARRPNMRRSPPPLPGAAALGSSGERRVPVGEASVAVGHDAVRHHAGWRRRGRSRSTALTEDRLEASRSSPPSPWPAPARRSTSSTMPLPDEPVPAVGDTLHRQGDTLAVCQPRAPAISSPRATRSRKPSTMRPGDGRV